MLGDYHLEYTTRVKKRLNLGCPSKFCFFGTICPRKLLLNGPNHACKPAVATVACH